MGFGATARAFANKERDELALLAGQGVQVVGNAFSQALVVKGVPGEAEMSGASLLSGEDGKALRAAFAKLGYAPEDWCGLACWRADGGMLEPTQLRLAVTVLDPSTIVACDEVASSLVCAAYAEDLVTLGGMLEPGSIAIVAGVRVLSLGGFEAALADMRSKQVMWARLKRIPPLGDPY